MLTLDHVFVRVDDIHTATAHLEAAGFDAGFQRDHPGQGTANRCALFPDSFLELLYVRDAAEAATNPLQLHARGPLGVALRGPLPGTVGADWWLYSPPYGGGTIAIDIHPASMSAPTTTPLVFCMRPAPPPPAARPGLDPVRLQHPNGARGIAWVRLEGAGAAAPIQAPWLQHTPGAGAPRMVVGIVGARLPVPVEISRSLVVCAAS